MSTTKRLDEIEAKHDKADRVRAMVGMLYLGLLYGVAVGVSIEQNRRNRTEREERERERIQDLEHDLERSRLVGEVLLERAGIGEDELERAVLARRQAEFERQWGRSA